MRDAPFQHTPLSRVGAFIDWLLGPSVTAKTEGPSKTREISLPTDASNPWPQATVSCVRVIYRTHYSRWWVPTVQRTLYTVSIDVPSLLIERYGEAPFAPVSYPLLCNHLLQWTTYPHLCAIHTYLDELYVTLDELRRK